MKAKKFNILFLLLVVASMALMYLPAFAGNGMPRITAEKNRDGRLQYATELLSFIKKIDNQIPSLSPSQEDWLKKEMAEYEKTKDIRRYIEIIKTKEHNIKKLGTGSHFPLTIQSTRPGISLVNSGQSPWPGGLSLRWHSAPRSAAGTAS